ncbi:MAG: SCO family protein [Flavobacteriales bacterium]|jgi:protein SCO1/2|nr:SCO family protein [Flavobacteriales bacterium]MBT5615043.1 SCO family protein [Flavobacteriales bacterium]MBT6650773.1 SCO family protein [Flavobacteriales bacterium]MDG2263749.1 SCO family protein [Flavobacteriales bacterium]
MYFYLTRGYNNFIKLEVIGEVDYSIDDFSFINQDNDTITKDSLLGSIYVANFFFTSCPSICPTMTRNMSYLQDKLSVYPNIRFLSHTVDPDNDTPEKLINYVDLMQQKNISIDLSNWDFVTGDKDKLYQSAANYFVNASVDSLAPGGFLHSEYFVLIDKQGRVRSGIDINGNIVGAYDGTNEVQMKDLINDINVLMAEYKRPLKDAKD